MSKRKIQEILEMYKTDPNLKYRPAEELSYIEVTACSLIVRGLNSLPDLHFPVESVRGYSLSDREPFGRVNLTVDHHIEFRKKYMLFIEYNRMTHRNEHTTIGYGQFKGKNKIFFREYMSRVYVSLL